MNEYAALFPFSIKMCFIFVALRLKVNEFLTKAVKKLLFCP